jgi:hypothetical protein
VPPIGRFHTDSRLRRGVMGVYRHGGMRLISLEHRPNPFEVAQAAQSMSGLPSSSSGHAVTKSPISIPFVILCAALIGIGTLSMIYWLITSQWVYFSGVLPCVLGALLLLDPRAGADRA